MRYVLLLALLTACSAKVPAPAQSSSSIASPSSGADTAAPQTQSKSAIIHNLDKAQENVDWTRRYIGPNDKVQQ